MAASLTTAETRIGGSPRRVASGMASAGNNPMDDVIRFSNARFGEQDVSADKVIRFADGVPGFEQFRSFALFTDPESDPFQWLLSTENPQLGFVVINPMFIWPDYNPRISRDDLASLSIEKPDDMLLFAIVTLSDEATKVTANLSGPIIVNATTLRGRQLALLDNRYSTKHRIMEALHT